MRGHRQIVKARLGGFKPATVFFDVGPVPAHPVFPVDRDMWHDALPQVWTDGADPATADLRWINGLRVHLSCPLGSDAELFARWFDALLRAGARIDGACLPNEQVLIACDIYGESA